MAQIPTNIDIALNTTFNYTGSVNELPKDGTAGQVVYNTSDYSLYTFNNAQWIAINSGFLSAPTKTIKEELLEVLDRHKGSKIAEDVRNLLEVYEKSSYI
jgi:hypothetical protein